MSNSVIGPLTTSFSAPAACSTSASAVYKIKTDSGFYLQQGPTDINKCYPDGYNPARTAYFSPGVCPSGYTAACSSINGIGSLTETAYTCCPTYGMGVASMIFECRPDAPRSPWINTLVCASDLPTTRYKLTSVWDVPSGSPSTSTSTTWVSHGGTVHAYGVQVKVQSTDIAEDKSFRTDVPGSGGNANSDTARKGGLSTGAVAGIAVGCSIAGLLLIAALGFLFCRRKQGKGAVIVQKGSTRNLVKDPSKELSARHGDTVELESMVPVELPAEQPPDRLSHHAA